MNASEIEISPVQHPKIQLLGRGIRTRNQDEMAPDSGKIPGLWASFYQDIAPKLSAGTTIYGVYSNYESDHTGHFDLHAVVASSDLASEKESWVPCEIQAGNYLKFTQKSPDKDPVKQVIGLWQFVWSYFEDASCPHRRAYSTDFERYESEAAVELFISLK